MYKGLQAHQESPAEHVIVFPNSKCCAGVWIYFPTHLLLLELPLQLSLSPSRSPKKPLRPRVGSGHPVIGVAYVYS